MKNEESNIVILISFFPQGRCNENTVQDIDQPVGEIEDFSRHGTTVRLTPEHTKLNSPESPTSKDAKMEEDLNSLDATVSMLERKKSSKSNRSNKSNKSNKSN